MEGWGWRPSPAISFVLSTTTTFSSGRLDKSLANSRSTVVLPTPGLPMMRRDACRETTSSGRHAPVRSTTPLTTRPIRAAMPITVAGGGVGLVMRLILLSKESSPTRLSGRQQEIHRCRVPSIPTRLEIATPPPSSQNISAKSCKSHCSHRLRGIWLCWGEGGVGVHTDSPKITTPEWIMKRFQRIRG